MQDEVVYCLGDPKWAQVFGRTINRVTCLRMAIGYKILLKYTIDGAYEVYARLRQLASSSGIIMAITTTGLTSVPCVLLVDFFQHLNF